MCGLVFLGVLLGGLFRGGIFYERPQASTKDVALLAEKVGKLVVLPEGETPQVAAVTDPEVLRSQPFFAEAKVGDIVLIYSKKAVLYDPIANKVIIVAPVNSSSSQAMELVPKFQGEKLDVDDPKAQNQF